MRYPVDLQRMRLPMASIPPHHPSDDLWRSGPVYSESDRPLARLVARPVREFLRVEAAGSLLLRAFLAAHPDEVVLVYTPADDPDANRIEWLWRWSRRERCLRRAPTPRSSAG